MTNDNENDKKTTNMKRTIILLFLALSASLVAQQAVVARGSENKNVSPETLASAIYVGMHNNYDCWIFEGKKNVKQFAVCNQNLEAVRLVELPDSRHTDILTSAIDGNKATVIVTDKSKKERTLVLRHTIDLLTGTMGAVPDTLENLTYGRKDECLVWGTTSPNGNLIGLVTIVVFTQQKQYRTLISLLSADGEELWEKEFALGSMKDLFVTNEGRIVTLGIEPEGEETHFIFNVLSQYKEAAYSMSVKCDPIRELKLVNVIGNHAIALGTFNPIDKDPAKDFTGGTLGLSFDIETAALTGFFMRPLQNEDMNILYNKQTKKMQRDQYADRVAPLGYTPTPFGAAMVVGRNFTVAMTDDAGELIQARQNVGLHMVAIDTLGAIKWIRNFRRNDIAKGNDYLLGIGLTTTNKGVALVKAEHPKYPATYDIAKDAKKYTAGDKSNLVVYTIADNGDVSKLVVEPKAKQTHMRTLKRPDGALLFLSAHGKKVRTATLKFMD